MKKKTLLFLEVLSRRLPERVRAANFYLKDASTTGDFF